jgi:hypothetical protein
MKRGRKSAFPMFLAATYLDLLHGLSYVFFSKVELATMPNRRKI